MDDDAPASKAIDIWIGKEGPVGVVAAGAAGAFFFLVVAALFFAGALASGWVVAGPEAAGRAIDIIGNGAGAAGVAVGIATGVGAGAGVGLGSGMLALVVVVDAAVLALPRDLVVLPVVSRRAASVQLFGTSRLARFAVVLTAVSGTREVDAGIAVDVEVISARGGLDLGFTATHSSPRLRFKTIL